MQVFDLKRGKAGLQFDNLWFTSESKQRGQHHQPFSGR